MSYEESIKHATEVIGPLLADLEAIGQYADKELAVFQDNLNDANATIEALSDVLRYSTDSGMTLVQWADHTWAKAYASSPDKDTRVRGWACWGSLYGGKSWAERAACEQVDHLSVTQKWTKWAPNVGFSGVSVAANKAGKGMWLAVHPGLGPEFPPDIQALVPQNQRVPTVVKGSASWYCPWWIESVRNAWLLGPIQQMADLHGKDPQLRMVRAAMPPMAMGEPYFDGAPNAANMKKWIAAWKAAGKSPGLSDNETWNQICDDYYKALGIVIEFLAVSFPESVMIAVAAGIGMGDTTGTRLGNMLNSLLSSTKARVCLQHNGLNHIPKTDGVWTPQESTDEWVLKTSEIAHNTGVILGYQTVTGAMGGGPGPMGPQGLDQALQVGTDVAMSYCEIYSVDIDAITEGNTEIAAVLDKHDRTVE